MPNPLGQDQISLSSDGFARYLYHFDLAMLGNFLGSDSVNDYQAKTAFRIYQLKDKKHAYYKEDAERLNLEKTSTSSWVYDDLYNNLIDTSKPSYQIILATNGKVYWNKDYNLSSPLLGDSYGLAPDDMQTAYQDYLEQYSTQDKS